MALTEKITGSKPAATSETTDSQQPKLSRPAAKPTPRSGVLPTHGHVLVRPPMAAHLSDEDVERLGAELDAIRDEVLAARGESDARYIKNLIKIQRGIELAGRVALMGSRSRSVWSLGVGLIALGKVLENMELGHNILHGQWDWMRDPDIHSTTWEWDFVAPARGWQHTHNDLHHTWTNVIGKDRDVGYNILRVSEDQPWTPRDVLNPLVNLLMAPMFEWGIASYDVEWDQYKAGNKSREQVMSDLADLRDKAIQMVLKDHIATPLAAASLSAVGGKLFGRKTKFAATAGRALSGALAANALRNVWAHAVIFCGHFPDGAETFSEEMIEGETRGDWYIRQMLGSANLDGTRLFHTLTGNLSHQIEHHLFPDLPSNRYIEVAPRVRDICERYGLPYNTGPFGVQLASTWRKICVLAFPTKQEWSAYRAARSGATEPAHTVA